MTAEGTNARVRDETRAAMADGVDTAELGPRAVQGYFSRLIARRMGGELEVREEADRVTFSAVLAA